MKCGKCGILYPANVDHECDRQNIIPHPIDGCTMLYKSPQSPANKTAAQMYKSRLTMDALNIDYTQMSQQIKY